MSITSISYILYFHLVSVSSIINGEKSNEKFNVKKRSESFLAACGTNMHTRNTSIQVGAGFHRCALAAVTFGNGDSPSPAPWPSARRKEKLRRKFRTKGFYPPEKRGDRGGGGGYRQVLQHGALPIPPILSIQKKIAGSLAPMSSTENTNQTPPSLSQNLLQPSAGKRKLPILLRRLAGCR